MKRCEFVLYNQKPISGKGKDRVWPKCGEPAVFMWTGRSSNNKMLLCREHGEALAGNYKDELKPI